VLATLALPAGSGGRWLRGLAAAVTAAGLLAAGTAVGLAGTGRLNKHGMIAIPALHDAASDRPLRFVPVCSHTAIPVCLNPAFTRYLGVTAVALEPVLSEIAGLPGAPARVSQAAARYQQGAANQIAIGLAGPRLSGRPPVYHLLLPDQLGLGPVLSTQAWASQVRTDDGAGLVASVTGFGPGASLAEDAVTAALLLAAGRPVLSASPEVRGGPAPPPVLVPQPVLTPGSPAFAAAHRFAALPATVRHAWLARHLAALRAGRITVAQLP